MLFPAGPEPVAVNRGIVLGGGLTAVGLAGYALGVVTAYPGRAFAVTLVMTGIALLAMRGAFDDEGVAP